MLGFDLDLADFIGRQLVGFVGLQAVDVEAVVDLGDATLHPTVAMAHPVFATHDGGFGVEPSQCGGELA